MSPIENYNVVTDSNGWKVKLYSNSLIISKYQKLALKEKFGFLPPPSFSLSLPLIMVRTKAFWRVIP